MTLTPRQIEVLRHRCAGKCFKEIGPLIGVGVKTVEYHWALLCRTVGTTDAAIVVQWAIAKGVHKNIFLLLLLLISVAAPAAQVPLRGSPPLYPSAYSKVGDTNLTLGWTGSGDTVTNYTVYASSNKINWAVFTNTSATEVMLKSVTIPYWFAVTATDTNGFESDFSNKLLVLAQAQRITVRGRHAPATSGPWVNYSSPVFVGTNVPGMDFFSLAISREWFWSSTTEP